MTNGWQDVPLGSLLTRIKDDVVIQDFEKYQRLTIRINNKGIDIRDELEGHLIGTKRQFVVHGGQFLLSKIDAMNGAFGIVPQYVSNGIITGNFWAYDVDEERLYPKYFNYLTHTPAFQDFCIQSSSGTTHRKYLQEDLFLSMEIPLPPLMEQRRIVAHIESLARRVHEAQCLREEADAETEKLWVAALNSAFSLSVTKDVSGKENAIQLLERQAAAYREQERQKYNGANPWSPTIIENGLWDIPRSWTWTDLGSCLTLLVDCVNDTPNFAEQRTEFIGLKSTNIRPYKLNTAQLWYMTEEDFDWWNRREKPKAGDLLITREAPMGNACIMPEGLTVCLTQRIMLLRTDERFVITKFLLHFLNSALFRQQVLEISRGLTTPHIRVQDMPKFKIPLPPFDEQRRVVAYLDGLQAKVNAMRELQSASREELSALMPSILDKAFKGEL